MYKKTKSKTDKETMSKRNEKQPVKGNAYVLVQETHRHTHTHTLYTDIYIYICILYISMSHESLYNHRHAHVCVYVYIYLSIFDVRIKRSDLTSSKNNKTNLKQQREGKRYTYKKKRNKKKTDRNVFFF